MEPFFFFSSGRVVVGDCVVFVFAVVVVYALSTRMEFHTILAAPSLSHTKLLNALHMQCCVATSLLKKPEGYKMIISHNQII